MSAHDSPCVLLTLGRLPVALDLARGFHALGWRVLVAEPFGMHLCRMSRAVSRSFTVTAPRDNATAYLDELARIAGDHAVQLLVPLSEESMHVAALRQRQLPGLRVFAPEQAQLLELHDKYRFNVLAGSFGLTVPPSAVAGSPQAAALIAAGETVIKPRYSCSGRGVRFLARAADPPKLRHAVVQQRVRGLPLSTFSLARNGRLVDTVVYRSAIDSGSVAVCFERVDHAPAVHAWVQAFVQHSAHDGFISFDFILDASGRAQAIECNPRTTSGLHFFQPESLAAAIADAGPRALVPRAEALQAESWSAFTACLGKLFSGSGFTAAWARLRAARDVSWSARDPWPFLLMMINTAPLISRALLQRRTFAEVAALDIEWAPPGGPEAGLD